MSDYFEYARALRVVDVWKEGNETGWVTPRVLYDPTVKVNKKAMAPTKGKTIAFFDHGTVGSNTLMFWCTGGSVASGAYTLAKYLVPHDITVYADGREHDTRNVVFKMIPDWAACNHTGECVGPFNNTNSIGVEYESLQNGKHDIGELQYIKGALIFAYEAVLNKIRDYFRVAHGLVAINPWGRRTDPWAGMFDIARSWEIVQAIRRDERIWALWGLPQPERGL
jgi:hypothetical protein